MDWLTSPAAWVALAALMALEIVVGAALIAEGFDWPVPRGYIYFGMAFSTVIEMLNIRMRKKDGTAQTP